MALTEHVTDRVSEQLLKEITNWKKRGATSLDSQILGHAADDIENMFQVYAGVAYDDTNGLHIPIAVEGVVALLMRRGKQSTGDRRWRDWLTTMEAFAKVNGRERVLPDSTSQLQPSTDTRLTSSPKPAFDDSRFDNVIPNPPGGS